MTSIADRNRAVVRDAVDARAAGLGSAFYHAAGKRLRWLPWIPDKLIEA